MKRRRKNFKVWVEVKVPVDPDLERLKVIMSPERRMREESF